VLLLLIHLLSFLSSTPCFMQFEDTELYNSVMKLVFLLVEAVSQDHLFKSHSIVQVKNASD